MIPEDKWLFNDKPTCLAIHDSLRYCRRLLVPSSFLKSSLFLNLYESQHRKLYAGWIDESYLQPVIFGITNFWIKRMQRQPSLDLFWLSLFTTLLTYIYLSPMQALITEFLTIEIVGCLLKNFWNWVLYTCCTVSTEVNMKLIMSSCRLFYDFLL